ETLVATVVNLETMSVTLSVDELDIININKTQEVDVTLDAIKGKTFKGKIISIDTDGTRTGTGNAKYSVKIEINRTDDMLTNMTASVRANISAAEVLSVPAEALFEKDNKTYCYTSYDKEKDTLSGEVEVKTGLSDGKNVEIVSGLKEGDQIWYKYAEGLVYRFVR
ncbi:MAG: HlyD family efflux transporter periplasmic adaptor subunit, partial [Clostridiales bacterium]|nr:HlyD family efflux transporter periplasmic adaptor subunit [Clostridiales bacterium]